MRDMSKDISVDLVNAESTKVSSPMESSKVAFIAVPVKYGVGSLRELQIIVGEENSLVVGGWGQQQCRGGGSRG